MGDLSHLQPETRLVRFTTTETALTCGTVVGYYVAGVVARLYGDIYVFVLTGSYLLLALLYCCLRLDNIQPQKEELTTGWLERLTCLLTVLSKPRQGRSRQMVQLFCVLFILQEAPRGFENTLKVLYIIEKFDWDSYQLLHYNALSSLCSGVGQFLIFPVLHKVMKIPLMLVGLMTVLSRTAYYLILAFPLHSSYLSVAAAVNCLIGVQAIIIRSGLAASLPSTDLGIVFAINEIVVTFLPILLSPVANAIYRITACAGCFQGAWAVVTCCPIIMQLPLFLALYFIET